MINRRRMMTNVLGGAGCSLILPSCSWVESDGASLAEAATTKPPLVVSPQFARSTKNLANSEDPLRQIGLGFDSIFGEELIFVADGAQKLTTISPGPQYHPNTFKYHFSETQESFNSVIRRSVRAKGRYGIFKGAVRGTSSNEVSTDSYSCHITAIVRKYRPGRYIDPKTLEISEKALEVYLENRKYPDLLLSQLGDSFISHLVPASELLVDMKFASRSRTDKRELSASLSASYGKLAEGRATYAEMVRLAGSNRRVDISVSGVGNDGVVLSPTPDEAQRLVNSFLRDEARAAYADAIGYTPISHLSYRGRPLNFVDNKELLSRKRFMSEVEASLIYFDNALRDIDYVKRNPDQFEGDTVKKALTERLLVEKAQEEVMRLAEDVKAESDDKTVSVHTFSVDRVKSLRPPLSEYVQKEPEKPVVVAATAIRTVPAAEPQGTGTGNWEH